MVSGDLASSTITRLDTNYILGSGHDPRLANHPQHPAPTSNHLTQPDTGAANGPGIVAGVQETALHRTA